MVTDVKAINVHVVHIALIEIDHHRTYMIIMTLAENGSRNEVENLYVVTLGSCLITKHAVDRVHQAQNVFPHAAI